MLYLSEYYYAASPNYWTLPGYDSNGNDYRNGAEENWIADKMSTWSISSYSGESSWYSPDAYFLASDGHVDITSTSAANGVRPTFSLIPDVKISGGSGTQSNPFRIAI